MASKQFSFFLIKIFFLKTFSIGRYYIEQLGYKGVNYPLSPLISKILANISYYVALISKRKISLGQFDLLTPVVLKLNNTQLMYVGDKAKRILGYSPIFTVEEGISKAAYEYIKFKKPSKN